MVWINRLLCHLQKYLFNNFFASPYNDKLFKTTFLPSTVVLSRFPSPSSLLSLFPRLHHQHRLSIISSSGTVHKHTALITAPGLTGPTFALLSSVPPVCVGQSLSSLFPLCWLHSCDKVRTGIIYVHHAAASTHLFIFTVALTWHINPAFELIHDRMNSAGFSHLTPKDCLW